MHDRLCQIHYALFCGHFIFWLSDMLNFHIDSLLIKLNLFFTFFKRMSCNFIYINPTVKKQSV